VGVWKNIRKGWEIFFYLCDGSKIRFQHDLWCVDHPLKATFLELISIVRCKEALVVNHVQ
jgi:hypothetical protein